MDYDDIFETLGNLLNTVNGAVADASMENDGAVPLFSYMFDREKDVFEGLGANDKEFMLTPWH